MTESLQWEYQVKTVGSFWKGTPDEEFTALLNAWGEAGWEVVGFRTIENSNQAQVIAKRPLTRETRRWRSLP